MAMLDTLNASGNRPLNGDWRVGMHGHVSSPVLRSFNRGPKFLRGKGGYVQWTVGRSHTAARHQLNLAGAKHELFAHAHTDFIWAVCNHADADLLRASQRAANGSRQFEPVTKIAVTACRRNHGTGRENARTCYNSLVDCLLEAEHGTAHVPNGGEASHQGVCGLGAGEQVVIPDIVRNRARGRGAD